MHTPDSGTPLDVRLLSFGATSGPVPLFTGRAWLLGLLLCNDDGAVPAACDVVDGSDGRGDPLGRLRVATLASSPLNLPRPGWPLDQGLTLVITGTLSGCATIGVPPR